MPPKKPAFDDRKLLSDEEFAEEAQRDFAASKSQPSAEREERVWANISAKLAKADRDIGAMSMRKKALIAGVVMAASACLAGIYIAGSLRPSEEVATTAIKGSDATRRVIEVGLTAANASNPNVVLASKASGWVSVFIRNGDRYAPWIAEAKLEPGDNPLFGIDHPLPVGFSWPAPDLDHSHYNVCAIAVTHRSALAMMASNITKLWSSFTEANCLY